MKIALFGGSFDPPHLGHDSIVKLALKELKIDRLIIMPTFISPFKSKFSAPPSLRLKWANALWGKLKNVEISDFEIAQNCPVPTINTVRHLLEIYEISKFYLIIGADHLATLDKWHEIALLKKLTELIIAERDSIIIPKDLAKMSVRVNVSSSQIRRAQALNEMPEIIKDEVIKFYSCK